MKKTFKIIVQNLLAYVSLNVFRGGQELVYTKIRDAIINGYRTMYIEGPTGMGKSFIQSTLADALINGSGIKVLLLVPKITLLSQMKREFTRFSKHLHLAMFGGGKKDHGEQVTIMTYQSFLNVSSQILKQYTIIFLDEAHKALGDMTRSKIEEQTHAIVIGFTATPNYSEKKNLKEFLKHEVYRISIPEAVKVGMLSPIQFIIGKVNIEVSGKQRNETTEEYKERLGKDIIREGGNIAAVKLYKKLFEKRGTRFAAFTASIAQGYDLVREFRENGVDAEIITGTTKLGDRENLFDDFNKNKFKILVSIDVLKEGFDDPGMHGVMFVYPVGSKVDLIQGAGRGTRIDDNNPNKVAFIVQLAFQTRKQVWYNDALEGKGPFVSPDEFGDIELKKVKQYNLVTSDELQDISDEIIESVSVEHEEVLSLIKGYASVEFYETYQEAKEAAMKLGIKSKAEYQIRYKEDPKLPSQPSVIYKNKGWVDWVVFLDKFYETYQEAKEAAMKLGIKSKAEYQIRYKEDPKLPSQPSVIYKNKGWVDWVVFLDKFYETYQEAKEAAMKLGIKSKAEYQIRYKEDPKLPSQPSVIYKNKGWVDLSTFLGTETKNFYETYQEAKEAAMKLGFKNMREYLNGYKEDPKLPSNPRVTYKNKGWVDLSTFLGKK